MQDDALLARLIRYRMVERSLIWFGPLSEDRLAAAYGMPIDRYIERRAAFEQTVERTATALLQDDDFARHLDRWDIPANGTVIAVGDSFTADRLSWFALLEAVTVDRLGEDAPRFINMAASAARTVDILERANSVAAAKPDLVFCQGGANDTLAGEDGLPLVSAEESIRNLAVAHDRVVKSHPSTRWAWIYPSRIDDVRVQADPMMRRAGLWRDAALDPIRCFIDDRHELIIRTADADANDLENDGLHPSLSGQVRMARAVVQAIAESRS